MAAWSVFCMEGNWPGLWRIWEERQLVTIGWPPGVQGEGWHYDGSGISDRSWTEVRNKLARIRIGDTVVARLPWNRIGRIGNVVSFRVKDEEWDPVVKPSTILPHGEQGRHVLVRWDLTLGPPDREWACALPESSRFTGGKWRRAIVALDSEETETLKRFLANPANWAPVAGLFPYERGLSDFIATFPDRLEMGLRPYPAAKKIREHVALGKKRVDVFLQDEDGTPVVVECKRGAPSSDDIEQLTVYMHQVEEKLQLAPGKVRGILVFGGSPNVSQAIARAAESVGVELFAYQLEVRFVPSSHRKNLQ